MPRQPLLCLVTCREIPDLTADDRRLAAAATAAGWSVTAMAWDDPSFDWAAPQAVVIRSTWDYHFRLDEFSAWLARCERHGAALWNPPSLVRWNLHKGYLLELEARGVPVVPTELVPRGAPAAAVESVLERRDWQRAVVKPAVSATAHGTFRVLTKDRRAAPPWGELLESGDLLIQPFVEEITARGELSFVFLAGRLSHVVRKRARDGDFRVQHDFGGQAEPLAPPRRLAEQARDILRSIPERPLYARIDAVERQGALVVMEIELIEPELFFRFAPGAPAALVAALGELLGGDRTPPGER